MGGAQTATLHLSSSTQLAHMASRNNTARVAGALYLIGIATTVFGLGYMPSQIVPPSDPTETLAKVRQMETLIRYGIVTGWIGFSVWTLLAIYLYQLFCDVSKIASASMVILICISGPLTFDAYGQLIDVVSLLHMPRNQPDLALTVAYKLQLFSNHLLAPMAFWGLWLFPLGYLVLRSRLAPRFLGVCLMIGCFGYLLFALGPIASPNYAGSVASRIAPILTLPAGIGEFGLCLWLLIKGAGGLNRAVEVANVAQR